MTKKEECYKIFAENDTKSRGYVIGLVVENVGVTQTTAQTYYPAWRNEYKNKPGYVAPPKHGMQEKVNNITETAPIIIARATKITKVAKKSPIKAIDTPLVDAANEPIIPDIDIKKIVSNAFAEAKEKFHENNEKTFDEAKECATIRNEKLIGEVKEIINSKGEGINWKADVINPVKAIEAKEDIFVTKLIPVVMKGKHGSYEFGKDGVKSIPYGDEFINKDKMDEAMEALEIWKNFYGKRGTQSC